MKTIYEWTGEFREPQKGEYYLDDADDAKPTKAYGNEGWKYWILSPRQKEATKDE